MSTIHIKLHLMRAEEMISNPAKLTCLHADKIDIGAKTLPNCGFISVVVLEIKRTSSYVCGRFKKAHVSSYVSEISDKRL